MKYIYIDMNFHMGTLLIYNHMVHKFQNSKKVTFIVGKKHSCSHSYILRYYVMILIQWTNVYTIE
jgi:hypothetical protein